MIVWPKQAVQAPMDLTRAAASACRIADCDGAPVPPDMTAVLADARVMVLRCALLIDWP
jgi:hypothetical protein